MNANVHEVAVRDVIAETSDSVTIVLDIPDHMTHEFEYSCGQFLTVRIPSSTTGSVARCYSLSSSPSRDSSPAITVKRTAAGYASNWLCDNIITGSVLTVLAPSGTFVPSTLNQDVLLCAAGSGITPIMSIAKTVLAGGEGAVTVLYANQNRASVIFDRQLAELEREYPQRLDVVHWLVEEKGVPTAAALADVVGSYTFDDVFVCGPAGFMDEIEKALLSIGVAEQRVRRETYRSLDSNPFESVAAPQARPTTGNAPVLAVEIDGQNHTLAWPKGSTLLDVLLDNGIDAPYVCRESICGTCVCSVRKGRTRMLMHDALTDDDIEMGVTLACQTLPESDEIFIAFDQ
ncbi:ferredoxin--NADP reductase [Antrihabitans sp. YC3-6]|uniref:Ferredoxin--NADP reductase n=1 Tax=Antrihabitans stalagmiti TaxID=2799499 RepID=A0A934NVR5_9NOCA|nr:ferredoxin--NADP reductase [Antrihabitans stalagmiti]MBJ8342035.1 ferredoxin--NADP reductase [Antrihabitans stalagmiti]